MSFAHPWLLLLLLIPLALGALEVARLFGRAGLHRAGRPALPVDLSTPALARAPLAQRTLAALLGGLTLTPVLLLAAAVLILAGPQRLGPPSNEKVLTNIEFVLDVSGSMSAAMASGGSRYQVAMGAINQFLKDRKDDAFGLTIFGGEVVRWVPLTRDLSAIANATPFLDPATLPSPLGSTRVGHALKFSKDTLTHARGVAQAEGRAPGDKLIVLITDGFSSDLSGGAANRIGTELAESQILVHAIHVGDGPPPGELVEVVTPTGGQVFAAQDPAGLAQIFQTISRMQPTRLQARQPEPVDHFTPLALAGLGLLALHLLGLLGLRYTPW
ncbi:MAG: vWA domain-containing protein [bacterium]|jgi:Ca-activated chloride channel family protein|nr:VWA domain-containing protein [Phycisphaerales bacterium]MCE2654089.1 VWA domain-containing protein [Planctomycetaceae bacterium]